MHERPNPPFVEDLEEDLELVDQVLDEATRDVRGEQARLRAAGIIDESGKLLPRAEPARAAAPTTTDRGRW